MTSAVELSRGAEAVIYHAGDSILKSRPQKSYRHPLIDSSLRKARTRREAKVLNDLVALGVRAPKLISVDDTLGRLQMEFLAGPKLRDVLEKDLSLACQVGEQVARLHDAGIMHGDLTTSNLLVVDGKVFLIDFGLSFHSAKAEDAAVDVHLFKQALKSKHHEVEAAAWRSFLRGYTPLKRDLIIQRLRLVERRGRNKV